SSEGESRLAVARYFVLPPVFRGLTAPRLAFPRSQALSNPHIPTRPNDRSGAEWDRTRPDRPSDLDRRRGDWTTPLGHRCWYRWRWPNLFGGRGTQFPWGEPRRSRRRHPRRARQLTSQAGRAFDRGVRVPASHAHHRVASRDRA